MTTCRWILRAFTFTLQPTAGVPWCYLVHVFVVFTLFVQRVVPKVHHGGMVCVEKVKVNSRRPQKSTLSKSNTHKKPKLFSSPRSNQPEAPSVLQTPSQCQGYSWTHGMARRRLV